MDFKKKLYILCFATLLVVFSFEFFLRADLFSPDKRVGQNADLKGKEVILVAGDSFVYGAGLKKGEDYPSLLEKILNKDNEKYKVINTGLPGQNTTQVYKRLQRDIKKYRPSIVLVQAGYNNATNFSGLTESEGFSIKYFFINLRIVRFFRNLFRFSEDLDDRYYERASWHIDDERSFDYQDDLPVKDFNHKVANTLGNDIKCQIPAYLPGHFSFKAKRFYSSIDYTEKKENSPGWDYIINLDFEDAYDFFRQNLLSANDYKGLLMSLFKLSRYEDALNYAEKAVRLFSNDNEIVLLWIKARAHNCETEFSKDFVVKKLSERLSDIQGDVSTLLVAGDVYKMLDNYRLALLWYQKALDLNSMASEPINRLLEYYTEKADLDNAKKYLEIGKRNNPFNLELKLYEKRIDMMQEGKEKDLKALLSLEKERPFLYTKVFVIDTLIMTSELHSEPIIQKIDEIINNEDRYSEKELLVTKAYYLEKTGKIEDAIKVYEQLYELTKKISYLKIKADLLYNLKKVEASIKEYKRIQDNLPVDKKYLVSFTLSFLYRQIDDYNGLISCYKLMYEKFPENKNVWFALIDSYISAQEYEKAINLINDLNKKSIEDTFTKRMLIERMTDIYIHRGEYKQAISSLKKLIVYLDDNQKKDAYTSIAEFYKVINEYQDAKKYYEKAGDKIALRELKYYLSKDQSRIYDWMREDYKRIIRLCKENNVRPVFVNYFEWQMPVMKEVAKDNNITFVDLYDKFHKRILTKDEYKSYFQQDGHLTKKGNDLTARMVFGQL